MPIYEYRCLVGHRQEHYVHRAEQAPAQYDCEQCLLSASRLFPTPNTQQYFSESSGRIIQNLAPGVPITSPRQHEQLMRAKGLTPATDWHTSKRQ